MSQAHFQPHGSRISALDGLRGVAVLAVVFLHYFNWGAPLGKEWTGIAHWVYVAAGKGWVGVQLFFVLSGYLITGILCDRKHEQHYFWNFYVRRSLRILPPYWCVLLLLPILTQNWAFLGISAAFLANFCPNFGINLEYPVLWSLSIEEHFYLLWPFVVRNLSARSLTYLCVLLTLGSPALRSLSLFLGQAPGAETWFCLDGLTMGALIALHSRGRYAQVFSMRRLSYSCFIGAFAICAAGIPFGFQTRTSLYGQGLVATVLNLAMAGIVAFALSPRTLFHDLLNGKALQFFGKISYSLYLFHLFVLFAVSRFIAQPNVHLWRQLPSFTTTVIFASISFALSVGVAYLSYRTIEQFFLSARERFLKREPRVENPAIAA